MKSIKFSVIIPTYNRGNILGRCVDSILNQTYNNFEIIIVDNSSTDNTDVLLRNYNDERIIILKIHNDGIIAKSRNLGVKNASGDYICFLDSDDWWCENKLSEVNEIINKTNADFIYHKLAVVDKNGTKKVMGNEILNTPFSFLIKYGNCISTSSVTIKKNILLNVGLMSEDLDLAGVEDADCWFKVARIADVKFYFIAKSLGYYWLDNNFSVSEKQIIKEERLVNKHLIYVDEKDRLDAISSLNYKKARIYHKIGDFLKAKIEYRKSMKHSDIKRVVSSGVLFMFCILKIKY